MRTVKPTLIALLLAALVTAGCGSNSPDTGGANPPAAQATQQGTTQQGSTQPATQPPTTPTGTRYVAVTADSVAAYAVGETFLGKDLNTTAVGKTSALTGELVLDGGVIQPSVVQVDVRTLKSDEARRDNQVRKALDTTNHPYATFHITGAEGNPVLTEGAEVALKLQGTMTIKGTEKPLVFDAKAKLAGDTLTLTATTTFNMTEFGVRPPSIAGFVSVKDEVRLDVTFVGKRS
jgi:polyisoprenoid-binding protein YceI